MRTPEEIREDLAERNPQAQLADGLDRALIGIAERCGQPALAAYSVGLAIEVLMEGGLSYEEAMEHFDFNVRGAWVGDDTPVWVE